MKKTTLLAALGLLAVLTFGPPPAQAAVTEAWVHRYSNVVSNSDDRALKVVRDGAGDIIVTGTTDDGITGRDMLTIKYSGADGSVLWQQRYNGPANSDDRATAMAVDGGGNVVVTGSSSGTNYDTDCYTAKYAAADGALLWEKRYDGPAKSDDRANAVVVDGSGNVVVTGSSFSGTNGAYPNYYTARYAAADGTLLWEKRGPSGGAHAVAVDGNGNVVITGSSFNGTNHDCYTAKYATADGATLWEIRGPGGGTQSIAVDGSDNLVVTGHSYGTNNNDAEYYTAKYAAANGTLLWEKRYHGSTNYGNYAQAVAVDSSGNVVVTGFSGNYPGYDYYTAKYSAADGALLWEQRGPRGYAHAVAVDSNGNVVVTGFSGNYPDIDYYTAKYAAADGALLWEKRYNGPANSDDRASAVVVDSSGNVVVTGYSEGNGTNNDDYYTAKYAATDGALLWEKRYNGLSRSHNGANAVAVDGSGNLVVTGFSEGNGTNNDYHYTAKYAGANGGLLWEKRSNGGATALAVDSSDNVVVTGYSYNGTNSDYYTAKYAAVDGALLWEKRYNGPANGGDSAAAVAVDASGNVVVTGTTDRGMSGYGGDYYTAKYAAADGALLWEKRYDGPAHDSDFATALAVDGNGNVVVTGASYNGSDQNTADYYTAKYAAADGALLWEKRYNGPEDRYDSASAVAVDASGNVVVTGISGAYLGCDGNCADEGDFYTAKYAGADGALLWEKRYNGPANVIDAAWGVVVDGIGNVVVTGTTDSYLYGIGDYYTAKYAGANGGLLWEKRGPSGYALAVEVDGSGNVVVTGGANNGAPNYDYDYWTAKYAAADGALLWEKRYNGAANGHDNAYSLALGPNGMVAVTGTSSGDYATVVYRDDVYPISVALIPAGVRLRFTGIPGRTYTIERAPAVTGPWSTINIQTAPASGLVEYVDTTPPAGSAFYRMAQP